MKNYFCTIVDKNYLFKGLALYFSMLEHIPNFHLWILCMDDPTNHILKKMCLKNVDLIRLRDFEDKSLKKIKDNRTISEYCWTCKPSLIWYILNNNQKLEYIGYLDADIYFFSDPESIFREWNNKSILIIPHNFPKYFQKRGEITGKYNASMVLFKNDINGKNCLKWWRNKCLDWCYYRYDDGRFCDQLYLNKWPNLFKDVHILKHIGGGAAPWNITNYKIRKKQNHIYLNKDRLVLYHFHSLDILGDNKFGYVKGYELTNNIKKWIYNPYISSLKKAIRLIRKYDAGFSYNISQEESFLPKIINNLFSFKLKIIRLLSKINIIIQI